jgi:hypothetical protein
VVDLAAAALPQGRGFRGLFEDAGNLGQEFVAV